MKRGYTALEYKSIVRRLRARAPRPRRSTSDFIVGFPGETDADLAATMKLIDDVGFDGSFSFLYSARPGTPAAELPDPVPRDVSQARLEALQAKLDGQYRAYSDAMVGTRAAGAGHRPRGEGRRRLSARTANNRVVNFAGDAALVGRYVDVAITLAYPHSLRGELVAG